jgi:hypothetical protein
MQYLSNKYDIMAIVMILESVPNDEDALLQKPGVRLGRINLWFNQLG